MSDLSQEQWQSQLAGDTNAVIVDVRTDEEVSEGYIPNAQHLDIYNPQAFMEGIEAFDKSKNYYVYCRSGGRSAQACAIMNQVGIENTYNLVGGFSEWQGEVANN